MPIVYLEASSNLTECLSLDSKGSLTELFSIFANKPNRLSHKSLPAVVVTYVELEPTEDLQTKLYMFKAAAFGELALLAVQGTIDDGDITTLVVGQAASVQAAWH